KTITAAGNQPLAVTSMRPTDGGKTITRTASDSARHQMVLEAALKWPESLKRLAPSLQMNQPLLIHGRLNTDSSLAALSFVLTDLGYQDFRLDSLHGALQTNADSMRGNITLSRLLHPRF